MPVGLAAAPVAVLLAMALQKSLALPLARLAR